MIKEANIQEDKDRYVVVTWDEMKIKGDLCFDKHTCELIGFTNIGEINNSLDQYEQYCKNPSSSTRSVASHMLVFFGQGDIHKFGICVCSVSYHRNHSCCIVSTGLGCSLSSRVQWIPGCCICL